MLSLLNALGFSIVVNASSTSRLRTGFLILGIVGGPFIIGMDMLSIGVALAPMAADLKASLSTLQWFMSGYGIGVAAFLITAGKLADLFGARNVNCAGLLLFGAASGLMALAPDSAVAISARLLQGVAGAFMISSSIGIAGQRFSGHQRAKVFSLIMAMAGLGMSLGPLAGGLLIHFFDWRAVFWINLPLTLYWFVNNTMALPKDENKKRKSFDFIGLVLLSATILLFVVPLSQASEWGWRSYRTVALFLGFALCLPLLIIWERRVKEPLLDLSVFRIRGFVPANLSAFLAYFVALGWLFLFSLYLHHVKGFGALATGFAFLPYSLGYFGAGMISTRMGEKLGWRRFLLVGLLVLTSGVGLLAMLSPLTPYWQLGFGFALVGIGYIAANNAAITLAQGEAPADKAGAASGISMMFRWLGSALGITAMTLVLHAASHQALESEVSRRAELPLPSARLAQVLTEDGSWSRQLAMLPGPARKEARTMLAVSYTTGISWGLTILAFCGMASLALVPLLPKP